MKNIVIVVCLCAIALAISVAGRHMVSDSAKPKFGVTITSSQIDYKFWYIKRDDSGVITEAAVRYFEGTTTTTVIPATSAVVTATTTRPAQATSTIKTYVRMKHLQQADLPQFSTQTIVTERNGNQDVVYTQKDFGTISTDAELQTFLNQQLAKDAARTPIPQQTVATKPI